MKRTVLPTEGRAVVEILAADTKTPGGLHLPVGSALGHCRIAKVVAVYPLDKVLSKGDTVVLSSFVGHEVEVDGRKLVIVEIKDVLALVEDGQ